LKVSPITTHELDRWAVEACGLPTRVVHYARAQGWSVVSDLRRMTVAEWTALPGLGAVSAQAVQDFFSFCDQLVAGRVSFPGVREVFEQFANEEERAVLLRRYGLLREDAGISRKFMTLQEIGNDLDLTRERVRQIEENARRRLGGQLAQACLFPFYERALGLIWSADGLLDAADREGLKGVEWLSGYAPGSVLLLLNDINPGCFVVCRERFAVPPLAMWEAAEAAALAHLKSVTEPVGIEALHGALGAVGLAVGAAALGKWLAGHPQVAATRDGRFFLYAHGGAAFLRELLGTDAQPTHYRALTERLQARLLPESRIGSRQVLAILRRSPPFRKTAPGYYAVC
jgi:hypothetical protein